MQLCLLQAANFHAERLSGKTCSTETSQETSSNRAVLSTLKHDDLTSPMTLHVASASTMRPELHRRA